MPPRAASPLAANSIMRAGRSIGKSSRRTSWRIRLDGPYLTPARLFLRGPPGGNGQSDLDGRVFVPCGYGGIAASDRTGCAGFGPLLGRTQTRGGPLHNTAGGSERLGHQALAVAPGARSEEHTSELQSLRHLVCRL